MSGRLRPLPEGSIVADFRIGHVLELRPASLVYLAENLLLRVSSTVTELMPPGLAHRVGTDVEAVPDEAAAFARLCDEVLQVARRRFPVAEPALAPLRSCYRSHGTVYLVHDRIEGVSLDTWLAGAPPPDEPTLRRMFFPLFQGVAACHRAGVVLGDLGVGTLVVRDDGTVAWTGSDGVAAAASRRPQLLDLAYAPPEQLARDPLSPAADVFYLAGCLLKAMTGAPPYRGNPDDVLAKRWPSNTMQPVRSADLFSAQEYPPAFLHAVDICLSQRKDMRPADASVALDLLGWRAPIAASPEPRLLYPPADPAAAQLLDLRRQAEGVAVVGLEGRPAATRRTIPPILGSVPAAQHPPVADRAMAAPSAPPPPPAHHGPAESRASLGPIALPLALLLAGAAAWFWRDGLAAALAPALKAVGLVSGSGGPFAAPPPAAGEAEGDVVEFSVFGPTSCAPGDEILLQVFLHALAEEGAVARAAAAVDPESAVRGTGTLAVDLAPDDVVTCVIEGEGLEGETMTGTLRWRRRAVSVQFALRVRPDVRSRRLLPKVHILRGQVPIGTLTFALPLVSAPPPPETTMLATSARRHRRAFLSYASPDRVEVLKRAQGLRAAGISIFQDVLSLEPGERWERRLYQEIDESDLFILFWSRAARQSEWVIRELDYARERRGAGETPMIVPVLLEGPPPPPPPQGMTDVHFDDPLCHALAAWSHT